jgi:hypothetical protein
LLWFTVCGRAGACVCVKDELIFVTSRCSHSPLRYGTHCTLRPRVLPPPPPPAAIDRMIARTNTPFYSHCQGTTGPLRWMRFSRARRVGSVTRPSTTGLWSISAQCEWAHSLFRSTLELGGDCTPCCALKLLHTLMQLRTCCAAVYCFIVFTNSRSLDCHIHTMCIQPPQTPLVHKLEQVHDFGNQPLGRHGLAHIWLVLPLNRRVCSVGTNGRHDGCDR